MTAPASAGGQTREELRFDMRSVLRLTSRDRANIRHAADLARLLPGEDPKTERQDDIEHWIVTYRELTAYNRELIRRLA
ncbi:MAG TPA: hypothetical protein VFR68_00370, partial [Candidatus Dormibacteraeota bacterium]|nr:hypothetical protein [Candidatus Dormibacteraeota bacterium]